MVLFHAQGFLLKKVKKGHFYRPCIGIHEIIKIDKFGVPLFQFEASDFNRLEVQL